MVKCEINENKKNIQITGEALIVLYEIETVLRKMREQLSESLGKEKAKEMIEMCYELSLLSNEERDADAEKFADKNKEEFKSFLERFVKRED